MKRCFFQFNERALIVLVMLLLEHGLMIRPAFCQTALQEGMADYKQGQYVLALYSFNRAVKQDPGSALAHYYRANTLCYLRQRDDALEDYKAAYALCPAHSDMAKYCMAALRSDESGSSAADAVAMKRRYLKQMLQNLDQELASGKQELASAASAESRQRLSTGEMQAQAVKQHYQEIADMLRANPLVYFIHSSCGWPWPVYIPRTQEIHEAEMQGQQSAQYRRAIAQQEASQMINTANKREAGLEESAVGLESQLLHAGASGPRISEFGTNLYVRNYVTGGGGKLQSPAQSEILPVPLVAKAMSLPYLTQAKKMMGKKGQAGSLPDASMVGRHARESILTPGTGQGSISTQTSTSSGVYGKVIEP